MPQPSGFPPDPIGPWSSLESVPGLIALPWAWSRRLGARFDLIKNLCLQPSACPAQLLPCPRGCGLAHPIVHHPDGSISAACDADPARPLRLSLSLPEITPLELSWARLGRALSRALGCSPKLCRLDACNTWQIGSWSADAVPAILTIQSDRHVFRSIIAQLAASLSTRFILLAPTSNHFDARALDLLHHARAGFFDLQSHVEITSQGSLRPTRSPGELFQHFNPEVKEIDQSVAERAFALVTQLSSDTKQKPPSTLLVFRLYCIQELTAQTIAAKSGCSKATVLRRLATIHHKTGIHPKDLRRYSSFLTKN